MERIYLVWLVNRKTRNNCLIKAFYSSEAALKERDYQLSLLKSSAKSLDYHVAVDSIEVY